MVEKPGGAELGCLGEDEVVRGHHAGEGAEGQVDGTVGERGEDELGLGGRGAEVQIWR